MRHRFNLNPLATVLRHDLRTITRSVRYRVVFAVALVLASLASMSGARRYLREVSERESLLAAAEQEWLSQDPKAPHPANHFGRWVIKPIEPLSIFDRGVEDFVGQRIVLDAHVKTPLVGAVSEEDPLRALLGGFDLSFVVAVLFPLLAIFVSYDTICGEKERGTLRQVLASPATRLQVFLGKLGALALVVLACFGTATVLGFVIPLCLGVRFDRGAAGQMAGLLGATLAYLGVFLGASVAVSASSARSSRALAVSLGFWLCSVFLVPRVAALVAATVHPASPLLSLHQEQQDLSRDLAVHRAARYRSVLEEIRKQHPEIPEDFGTQGHNGHHASADPSWTIDPTGVFISEANAILNQRRDQAIARSSAAGRRQQALAGAIAQVSPTVLVLMTWSRLALTDSFHHQWFKSAVDDCFLRFGAYFNHLWAHNVKQLSDFSAAPRFVYQREPYAVAVRRARMPFVALMVLAVAVTGIAAFRLKGYDAR